MKYDSLPVMVKVTVHSQGGVHARSRQYEIHQDNLGVCRAVGSCLNEVLDRQIACETLAEAIGFVCCDENGGPLNAAEAELLKAADAFLAECEKEDKP